MLCCDLNHTGYRFGMHKKSRLDLSQDGFENDFDIDLQLR